MASVEGDFWELHRRLGECYARDVNGPIQSMALQSMATPTQSTALRPGSPTNKAQTLALPEAFVPPGSRRNSHTTLALPDVAMPGSRRHSRVLLSNVSNISKVSEVIAMQNFGMSQTAEVAIPADVRIEELRGRRKQTMKTLAFSQGLNIEESEEVTKLVDLKLHECWNVQGTSSKAASKMKKAAGGLSRRMSVEFAAPLPTGTSANEGHVEASHSCLARLILHPGGLFRTIWNLVVALCVLHDVVMIPLSAFNLSETTFLSVLQWIVLLSWNIDLLVSLVTGFYDDGTLVMIPLQIWKNYAKTWMLFDVSLITLDWTLVVIGDSSSSNRSSNEWQTLRLLRSLRLVRMLRMIKLRRAHEAFQEMLHSQASSLYFGLFSSLAYLIVLNHFIACAFFAMSHLSTENWVRELGLEDAGVEYQYLTCMNWAFAQLGVGSSNAKPTNSLEMAFCIVIAFRSLMTAASLISTVSNLMAGLSKIKEDENTEFRLLRCYLKQNEIPPPLSQKVTQFLQHEYSLRQEARSADMEVPVLALLSKQLQGELQLARYNHALCKMPVVDGILKMQDLQVLQVMQKMARTAISNAVVANKDVIFLAGSEAKAAYLTQSGSLTYFHDNGTESVHLDFWIAEVCLWTPWVYLGDLVADDVSRLVIIDADEFCSALANCWQTHNAARSHAQEFLEAMRKEQTWTDVVKVEPDLDGSEDSAQVHQKPSREGFFRWPWRTTAVVPQPEELS